MIEERIGYFFLGVWVGMVLTVLGFASIGAIW